MTEKRLPLESAQQMTEPVRCGIQMRGIDLTNISRKHYFAPLSQTAHQCFYFVRHEIPGFSGNPSRMSRVRQGVLWPHGQCLPGVVTDRSGLVFGFLFLAVERYQQAFQIGIMLLDRTNRLLR